MDLDTRMGDDLGGRLTVVLDDAELAYFRPEGPPFGAAFAAAFARADAETLEAARCLAFGCDTAAVFHLMRAMETVVQALAARLGVSAGERAWVRC